MGFINWKPQVQKLELPVVTIEQIATGGIVLASTAHVLPQSVKDGAFFGIALRIVAVRFADVRFQRVDPINLTGLFQRRGYHRRLHLDTVTDVEAMLVIGNVYVGKVIVMFPQRLGICLSSHSFHDRGGRLQIRRT